ncbi:DMT family transporter [Ampullimonas aquatilis]|uniref:DMT family transporter n=1 Tax=Ampullimonas aquatilis TaxID=1341549 RepID=UPI003C74C877
MRIWMILQALVAGAILPVQAAINGQLRTYLISPILTSLASFLTGTFFLAVLHFSISPCLPTVEVLSGPRYWMWFGGSLGVIFVLTTITVTPELGAGTTMALIITGQLGMALFLDQSGLIGMQIRELVPLRIAGAVLLMAGALLISNN